MYVGLDVHKDFCQACFLDEEGIVVKETSFSTNKNGLEDLVEATRNSKVVMEASGSSLHIYDALSETCTVTVAHPSKVKVIASARIKTDKIDARILAQLLRADMIPKSFIPVKKHRQARLLVRHRASLVRTRTRIKNQIHALLTKEGVKVPFKEAFGKKGILFLHDVELGEMQRISMNSLLSLLESFNEQIRGFEKRIRDMASQDAYAKRLVEMKGVGHLTALAVSSEVCDVSRFPSYKHFCSFLGLVPSIRQSGNVERRGHITKQGNNLIRWLLIQDARVAVKHSERFKRKYHRLLAKGVDENKAIVAIARNMAVIMYLMLVRNEPYRDESKGGKPVTSLGR